MQARFFQPKPFEEFYDLEADPDEVNNIADEPDEGAAVLSAMRRALDDHLLAINDNGFIPKGCALEGYLASRQPGRYPLGQVIAVAERAASGREGEVPDLVRDLGSDNEVIRYWAATGLLIRASDAASAVGAMLDALEAESTPQVRVVLTEGLAHVGHTDLGVAELASLLSDDQPEMVRLQALNALTWLDDPSPAMPMVERLVDDRGYLGRAATYLARVQDETFDPSASLLPPWNG
ncbi:HEAT repeat domain-containing protein [Citromicrobium bathyomarinum]|uniref:HEAT repeat domain-containing protein n=1 Tax=Citromicrobium bathyomarinum TaxID=72174 RepID=UPI00315AA761